LIFSKKHKLKKFFELNKELEEIGEKIFGNAWQRKDKDFEFAHKITHYKIF
jgi:hypothetical protein